MKWTLIILFFLNLSFAGSFRTSPTRPVEITAGRSIYKWEIKKLILENSNKIQPTINYENSILRSELMIYDDMIKKGFAYGNVYYEDKKENIIMKAEEGVYDESTKEITLSKKPKIILKKDGTIATGDKIKIYPEKDIILIIGNVKVSNTNIIVKSDIAEINQSKSTFIVKNNVEVIEKDSKLYADKLYLDTKKKNQESYTATGNVKIVDEKEGYAIYGNRLDYLKEEGYTRITGGYSNNTKPFIDFKEKNARAYSIAMEKFDKDEKANLLGDVVITQGKRTAKAMWGEYFIKKKKVTLTGNPMLEENNSRFQSYKINVDIENETMNMIGKGSGIYQLKN